MSDSESVDYEYSDNSERDAGMSQFEFSDHDMEHEGPSAADLCNDDGNKVETPVGPMLQMCPKHPPGRETT